MIKSITKPENATVQPENTTTAPKRAVEEVFKAMAMQPVQDWSSNNGIPFIAQVNPYAAAGMGFANQMANPFKQKYFENKAKANSEEEARRLNYEYARQKEQDDRQKGLFDLQKKQYERDEKQRELDNMASIEAEDVNMPYMSNIENFASPEDAAQIKWAVELLSKPVDMTINTREDRIKYNELLRQRAQARSIVNAFNLMHAHMANKIPVKNVYDPRKDKSIGLWEKAKRTWNTPQEQLFSLQLQDVVNKGLPGGNFAAKLIELGSFGKDSNDQAKVLSKMNDIYNEFEGKGFTGNVVSKDNLDFQPAGNNQVFAKQIQIKKMLDSKYAYVVQMTSPNGMNTQSFLVTPDGVQNISDVIVTTTQIANQDAATNRAADIRGALGG